MHPTSPSPPSPSHPSPPSHPVDFSLEEALLDKTNREDLSRSKSYALPSPKLSRIEVNTSRSIGGVKPASSAMRKFGQEKRNKRGLTVSFVQQDTGGKSMRRPGTPAAGSSKSKFSRHTTQRNIDTGLIDSLNSSRHGAMEQRYSEARGQEPRSPGGYPGGDPRLGYDWIAGLLDASESYLSEKDDDYFREINEFRRVNYEDCHRPKQVL